MIESVNHAVKGQRQLIRDDSVTSSVGRECPNGDFAEREQENYELDQTNKRSGKSECKFQTRRTKNDAKEMNKTHYNKVRK